MSNTGRPARTAKADLFGGNPVFQNTAVCRQLYTPETGLSDLHFHEFIEISIVTEGSGIHCVFNDATECHAGDIYILNTGVPHGYFAKSPAEYPTVCNLTFDAADWFTGAEARPDDPHFCYGIFKNSPPFSYAMLAPGVLDEVMRLYGSVAKEVGARRPDWENAVRAYITLLLITVERYVNASEQSTFTTKASFLVSSALRIAADQISNEETTLENIAGALHISKSHLSRLFRQVTGTTFSDHMQHIRVLRARRLLKETELSNVEIAHACGLRDVPTFYQLFRSKTGLTPHQFRAMQNTPDSTEALLAPALLAGISEALQKGQARDLEERLQNALKQGVPAQTILDEGLLAGMQVIGQRFRGNEIYIPEVLLASRAMNRGLQLLKPLLVGAPQGITGRVCIGTVQGDLHDIGKNLVRILLESKGLEVIDLGVDVPPERFIRTALEQDCKLICCSVLLSTAMEAMAGVVRCAEQAGVRSRFRILVGGAPVTADFCRQIGADLYAPDAATTADLAAELLREDAPQKQE